MERWPNLFIVGAPKAGTSSIYFYLAQIQEIFMSPIKEPNFFSVQSVPATSQLKPIRDKKKYLNLFKNAKKENYLGEASPSYLGDPLASKLIHKVSPNSKIIISLRDPVERTFSHYLMALRLGTFSKSFHDELEQAFKNNEKNKSRFLRVIIEERGLYYESVKRYLETFGPKQVEIIIFEEFISDPKKTLQKILQFLNLKSDIKNLKMEVFNPFVIPRSKIGKFAYRNRTMRRVLEMTLSPPIRKKLKEKLIVKKASKPKMREEDRNTLINFFKEDVEKIQILLNKELPWSNFSKKTS